ncbi:hypothetical protein CON82_23540 [Bacillus wiedmannii]|nr:hypothetical protein BtSCAC15_31265 [Bacillus thuringiensis]MBG9521328.1 hypothetical protein [Bacillus thuringiensis]PDZ43515.1 hypothetical protein CON82_23540 [Bacillus wiedmannii]
MLAVLLCFEKEGIPGALFCEKTRVIIPNFICTVEGRNFSMCMMTKKRHRKISHMLLNFFNSSERNMNLNGLAMKELLNIQ